MNDDMEIKRRHWAELLDAIYRRCGYLDVGNMGQETWVDFHDACGGLVDEGSGKDYISLYEYLGLTDKDENSAFVRSRTGQVRLYEQDDNFYKDDLLPGDLLLTRYRAYINLSRKKENGSFEPVCLILDEGRIKVADHEPNHEKVLFEEWISSDND